MNIILVEIKTIILGFLKFYHFTLYACPFLHMQNKVLMEELNMNFDSITLCKLPRDLLKIKGERTLQMKIILISIIEFFRQNYYGN